METSEREVVAEVIAECAKGDGWANLAEVGILLRLRNIRYGKLSKFVQKFPELIEIRADDSRIPPVAYARLREIFPEKGNA